MFSLRERDTKQVSDAFIIQPGKLSTIVCGVFEGVTTPKRLLGFLLNSTRGRGMAGVGVTR
jgi:hypothetical protein